MLIDPFYFWQAQNKFYFHHSQKHRNYIFSSGIDLIHEFFNLERKTKNNFLSKSIQYFNKNPSVNKIFTKIADKGLLF